MRIIIAPVLLALWLIHILYRIFIKKDMRQNPDELYLGAGFTVVWIAIYWYIFA